MQINKIQTTVLVLGFSLMTWSAVNADVEHRQPNELNTFTYVSDDPWQPEGFVNGTPVPAAYLTTANIELDGKDDEPEWIKSPEVSISLSYGDVENATLKALYTDEEIFIRVRWADPTPDRDHHPWVWDVEKQAYVVGPQVEDSVMLSFEAGCEWTPSLLGGYMYDFDGWHWMAARSDPVGQAVDLYGNVQDQGMKNPDFHRFESRVREDDWVMKFTENHDVDLNAHWDDLDRVYMKQPVTTELYLRAVPDGGHRSPDFVEQLAPPSGEPGDKHQVFPQFSPVKLTGGAGEVSAKGHWQDGFWTVEFRRDRITPAKHIDDTIFNRLVQFSVHVFDQTERVDEASESARLFLQFLPAEPSLAKE